jgi:hypothetical protein
MLPIAVGGGLIAYMVAKAVTWIQVWPDIRAMILYADHAIYMRQADRILHGGPLYPAWELSGPFTLEQLPELYPPPTVYGLFIPMSFLPEVLWWAIPFAIIAAIAWWHRPSPWAWVAVLACFAAPPTWRTIAVGNPCIWAAAALALGTRWGWPAVFVALKPSIAPFALLGVRTRGWWIAAVGLGLVSLVMIEGWIDYLMVLRNMTTFEPGYSTGNVPLLLIPLVVTPEAARLAASLRDRLAGLVTGGAPPRGSPSPRAG